MSHRTALSLSTMALLCLGTVLSARPVVAQTAKDLVGTWSAASIVNTRPDGSKAELFGANPKAMVMFDGNGHFVLDQVNPDIPKFKSNNRAQGTPEENKAVVQGSLSYHGSYSVADKVISFKIEGSSFPNWIGTDQKRPVTSFTGDELKWTNPGASVGGTAETVWKRVK
jgi:Lipocalin-like domain